MSKCKLWSPSRISLAIKILYSYTLVTYRLHILGVPQWVFKTLSCIFFGWVFFSTCGAYQWFSSLGKCIGCIGHFFLMCHSSTFLFHSNSTSFLFVSFGKFQQKHFAGMWGHYGSRVMGVYLGPLNKALGPTTNHLWWYMPFIYKELCPICFSRELGFVGSVFVLQVLYFW